MQARRSRSEHVPEMTYPGYWDSGAASAYASIERALLPVRAYMLLLEINDEILKTTRTNMGVIHAGATHETPLDPGKRMMRLISLATSSRSLKKV